MLTLGNIFVLMLLATGAAWIWHNHGLRERALASTSQQIGGALGLALLVSLANAGGTTGAAQASSAGITTQLWKPGSTRSWPR